MLTEERKCGFIIVNHKRARNIEHGCSKSRHTKKRYDRKIRERANLENSQATMPTDYL
jgi:hypothetical protein